MSETPASGDGGTDSADAGASCALVDGGCVALRDDAWCGTPIVGHIVDVDASCWSGELAIDCALSGNGAIGCFLVDTPMGRVMVRTPSQGWGPAMLVDRPYEITECSAGEYAIASGTFDACE